MARHVDLPSTLEPFGLTREEAAAACRISASKFDQLVADGRMPQPRMIDGRRVWSTTEVRRAFHALPKKGGDGERNEWDDAA